MLEILLQCILILINQLLQLIMLGLSPCYHLLSPLLNLFTDPNPYYGILSHLGNLLPNIVEQHLVNAVPVVQLLLHVRTHHLLLVLELVQTARLVLIDQLNGAVDALRRSLHLLIDSHIRSRIALAHLLHDHLGLEKLLVRLILGFNHKLDGVDDWSWDVLPGLRLQLEDLGYAVQVHLV